MKSAMFASLMTSKLQPPPARRELLARPHMIERLSSDLWDGEAFTRKVTLICASAGSGKTTLAADWLRHSSFPYAWLSLDEHENDPNRFLAYLIAACRQVDERLGEAAWNTLQSPQPPPPPELLAILISEITTFGKPLILALDDYHVIQTAAVHQQTNFLIDYQPRNLHLVIVTREDPPIPVSRLRARGQLLEVRQGDLRFSVEECARFLVEAMGIQLSADQVAALARRTEGWAVGLQLAALALRGTANPEAFVQSFTGSHRYILDYLLDEVLDRQPDSVQQFLLRTSILERLSGPLCEAVTGRKDSAAQLHALDAANLFIFALDQTRTWYRYHRLFTELLRHRLQLQPEVDVKSLHRTASRWCEENQYPQEAIQHALAAADWSRAGEMICDQSELLLKNGELTTLIGWCQRLPEQVLGSDARLCLAYAWPLLLRSQPEHAARLLAQAEQLADNEPNDLPLQGEIAAAQAFLAQVQGDGARLIAYSERALALLTGDRLSNRGVVALNLGLAYWHMGRMDAADKAFGEALRAGLATGNHYASLTAQIFLARSLAVRGQLHQAQEQFLEILKLPVRPPIMTLVYLDLATLDYEWNHLPQAEAYLAQGLQAAQRSGNPEFLIGAYLLQARLCLAQGRRGSAVEAVQAAENIVTSGKVPSRTQERIEVLRLELSLGIVPAFQEEGALPDNIDAHPFYRFIGLSEVRQLLAQDRKPQATARLAELVKAAERAGWTYGLVVLHTLQALAAGSIPAAFEALRKALDLAQPQGFIRTFVDAGPQLIPLLQQTAREGAHPLYAGAILAAFQADSSTWQAASRSGSAAAEGTLVEALSDRELEVLRLMAAGLSNRQIASQLVLSLGTVKTHLHNIYGKLEARNRPQAVDRARRLELL